LIEQIHYRMCSILRGRGRESRGWMRPTGAKLSEREAAHRRQRRRPLRS